MIKSKITLLILSLSLSACTTLARGTNEVVNIQSEPSGAKAVSDIPSESQTRAIDGFLGCEPTPCDINLPRKSSPVITVSKSGFQGIKFKIISSNATSKSAIPTGTIVAGIPPGSYVQAGEPGVLSSIPVGGIILLDAVRTLGVSAVIDAASGAGKSLSPNPVTVFLAPEAEQAVSPATST